MSDSSPNIVPPVNEPPDLGIFANFNQMLVTRYFMEPFLYLKIRFWWDKREKALKARSYMHQQWSKIPNNGKGRTVHTSFGIFLFIAFPALFGPDQMSHLSYLSVWDTVLAQFMVEARPIHRGQSFPWTSFETPLCIVAGNLNAIHFSWEQPMLCPTGCGRVRVEQGREFQKDAQWLTCTHWSWIKVAIICRVYEVNTVTRSQRDVFSSQHLRTVWVRETQEWKKERKTQTGNKHFH